jgi:hypothetical protein
MVHVPFDPADPPAAPPPGCGDELLWHVAYDLHRAHTDIDTDGFCRCREFSPCAGSRLAALGLTAAFLRRPYRRAGTERDALRARLMHGDTGTPPPP